jgi:hypothetical protein
MNGGSGDDLFFNADGEADDLDGGPGNDTRQTDPLDTAVNIENVTPAPAFATLSVGSDGSVASVVAGADGPTTAMNANDVGGAEMVAVTGTPIAGVMRV